MGVILSLLPKQLVLPQGASLSNFSNVVEGSTPLYQSAKRNYDKAVNDLTATNSSLSNKQAELTPLQSFVDTFRPQINDNNWRAAYEEILQRGHYMYDTMWPGYRTRFPAASMNDYHNDIYTGYSTATAFQEVEKDIIRQAIEQTEQKVSQLKSDIKDLERTKSSQESRVASAKRQLDAAVQKEKELSDQRIRENMSDPAYIAAQAKAAQQKRTTYAVAGVLGLAILIGGGALIFKK